MLLQAHWTEPVWRPRVTYLDVGSKDRTSAEAILRKAPPSAAGLFDGRLVPTSERVPVGRTERRAARVAQYRLNVHSIIPTCMGSHLPVRGRRAPG
jgi:hypothetical protein